MPSFIHTSVTVDSSLRGYCHLSIETAHLLVAVCLVMWGDSIITNECLLCYSSDNTQQYFNSRSVQYIGCFDHPLIYTINNVCKPHHSIPFADTSHHSAEPVMSQNSHIVCVHTYTVQSTIDTVYEGSITAPSQHMMSTGYLPTVPGAFLNVYHLTSTACIRCMLCCDVKFVIKFVSRKSCERYDVFTALSRKIKVSWDMKSSWTAQH